MPDLAEPAKLMESLAEAVSDPRYAHIAFLHDRVAFTPDMTKAGFEAIQDFPMQDGDVAVVGYPKSGTNWVTIVVSRLYPDWASNRDPSGRVPDLHVPDRPKIGFVGFEHALASPSPRLLKSHANFRHMPRAFREGKRGKAIYVTRNPKDVCDSYFGQLAGWHPEGFGWDDHVEHFINGHVFFGSWLENVLGWHEHGAEDNVLHISYEQMNADRPGTMQRIVDFIGPVPEGTIERVLEETGFEAMQKGDLSKLYQPQMLRRKGGSGGWRKRFSKEQSEAMDAAFAGPLADAGIVVDYGAED